MTQWGENERALFGWGSEENFLNWILDKMKGKNIFRDGRDRDGTFLLKKYFFVLF